MVPRARDSREGEAEGQDALEGVRIHPAAAEFPLIQGEEFAALVEDVRAHGLVHPIVLDSEGQVLDGRNRLRACAVVGFTPRYERYQGDDPIGYVISTNMARRHLNASQRAALAVRLLPMFEARAKERQGHRSDLLGKNAQKSARAREEAATALGAGERYVQEAKRIAEVAPEKLEEIKRGEKTIPRVNREIRREELRTKEIALPDGIFRVLYADCPWMHGDTRDGIGSSAAADHYPPMKTVDICALPVAEHAAEDAVLFLWACCPMLEDALAVGKAWGFKYRQLFVWDKQRHNVGHYHGAQAELLLIFTRGSCPSVDCSADQVLSIARGEHSAKPEAFRELIDRMYPQGPRVELFRRGEAPPGWTVWGNEAGLNRDQHELQV